MYTSQSSQQPPGHATQILEAGWDGTIWNLTSPHLVPVGPSGAQWGAESPPLANGKQMVCMAVLCFCWGGISRVGGGGKQASSLAFCQQGAVSWRITLAQVGVQDIRREAEYSPHPGLHMTPKQGSLGRDKIGSKVLLYNASKILDTIKHHSSYQESGQSPSERETTINRCQHWDESDVEIIWEGI